MDSIITKIKALYASALAWCKQNMTVVYILLAVVGAIFIFPKVYRKLFKRTRRIKHRRTHVVKRHTLRRSAAGRGKGSAYMKRKMARLRSMRRKKR